MLKRHMMDEARNRNIGGTMNIRSIRKAAVSLAAASGLLAAVASAASAAPATFSSTGAATPSESQALVVKAGTTPTLARTYTCAPANIYSQTFSTTNTLGTGYLNFRLQALCKSGTNATSQVTLDSIGAGFAGTNTAGVYSMTKATTMLVNIVDGVPISSMPNNLLMTPSTAAWTAGTSPINPSVVTFNNTTIGIAGTAASGIQGQPITLSGAIAVSPMAGGVLSLI